MVSENNISLAQIRLSNGLNIPQVGLGVYQSPPGEITQHAVRYALDIGYRHFDTAKIYGNEADVGYAISKSGYSRETIFITTKVWNSDQGYEMTLKACQSSLKRLGLDYVDLYLIHWPVRGKGNETWKAMQKILHDGLARSIGVSNYDISQLEELIDNFDIIPSINQVEFHPFLYQKELLAFCNSKNIQLEAYSPLTRGIKLRHPTLVQAAEKYSKTPAQILIRWSLQHHLVVIPKSTRERRIKENAEVFDFTIGDKDMAMLNSLDENFRTVLLT